MIVFFLTLAVAVFAADAARADKCADLVKAEADAFQKLAPTNQPWYDLEMQPIVKACERLVTDWNNGHNEEHELIATKVLAGKYPDSNYAAPLVNKPRFYAAALERAQTLLGSNKINAVAVITAIHDFMHGRVRMAHELKILGTHPPTQRYRLTSREL